MKKRASFVKLIGQFIVVAVELFCASTLLQVVTDDSFTKGEEAAVIGTIVFFWLGIGLLTRIFCTIGSLFDMAHIVKRWQLKFLKSLLMGGLIFVAMIATHAIGFFSYLFSYLFGTAYDDGAGNTGNTATASNSYGMAKQTVVNENKPGRRDSEYRAAIKQGIESISVSSVSVTGNPIVPSGEIWVEDRNGGFLWIHIQLTLSSPSYGTHPTEKHVDEITDAIAIYVKKEAQAILQEEKPGVDSRWCYKIGNIDFSSITKNF